MRPSSQPVRIVSMTIIVLASVLGAIYLAISLVGATLLVAQKSSSILQTPGDLGVSYTDVSFQSRVDHVQLKGWVIPGVLPDGHLTMYRTLIVCHGAYTNRTDPNDNLLSLQVALAKQGFAILAFDFRGEGQSGPAPFSLGEFEQRDVLGAVDFLQNGNLPYASLGRPHVIGGLGMSMGAGTLLLSAAQEPAIKAIVADSATADTSTVLQRQIPKSSGLPTFFTPGVLTASLAIFGIDFRGIRPLDVVAGLAPRPLFFIAGSEDDFVGITQFPQLVKAASAPANSQVTSWLVPGARHVQSYNQEGQEYVNRVVAFLNTSLGQDPSA